MLSLCQKYVSARYSSHNNNNNNIHIYLIIILKLGPTHKGSKVLGAPSTCHFSDICKNQVTLFHSVNTVAIMEMRRTELVHITTSRYQREIVRPIPRDLVLLENCVVGDLHKTPPLSHPESKSRPRPPTRLLLRPVLVFCRSSSSSSVVFFCCCFDSLSERLSRSFFLTFAELEAYSPPPLPPSR